MMKPTYPNNLGRALVSFFQDYLPAQRGMSAHTVRSYRDAIVLFLRFVTQHAGQPVETLEIGDLRPDRVTSFLAQLEDRRGNRVATRNARLAALHTLAKFLAMEHPQHMGSLQAVLAVPFKRGARSIPMEYLEQNEVAGLLTSIDRSTALGRRDVKVRESPFLFEPRHAATLRIESMTSRARTRCRRAIRTVAQRRPRRRRSAMRFCAPAWTRARVR